MNETKTYILGYNRYENRVIMYSTSEQAERSGSPWMVIESNSYKEAKEEFLEKYREQQENE